MNQLYDPYLTNNPYHQQPLQPQTFPAYGNSSRNPLHPVSMPSFINSGQDLLLFRLEMLEKNMRQKFDDILQTLAPLRDIADILQTVQIIREICTSTERWWQDSKAEQNNGKFNHNITLNIENNTPNNPQHTSTTASPIDKNQWQ